MADAVVRIWWFSWGGTQRLLGGGHGSLELPLPNKAYITWLGGREDRIRAGTYGFGDDLAPPPEGFGSNYEEFPIPLRSPGQCGLSAERIVRWWAAERQRRPAYHLLINNCDHSVVAALRAGGAELYHSNWHFAVQGATSLKRWVRQLTERIDRMQALIDAARPALQGPASTVDVLQKASGENWAPNDFGEERPEIWKLADWKTWSSVTMAIRKEQVAAIDTLLPEYHACDAGDYSKRLDILNQILALAVDHLKKKPGSQRRVAVMKLARQVYDKIHEVEEKGWNRSPAGMAMALVGRRLA